VASEAEHIELHRFRGVPVVRFLRSELTDPEYLELAQEEVYALVTAERPKLLVVDLSAVILVSSMALGMLMLAVRALAKHGGVLAVAGAAEEVREVFAVTEFRKLVRLCDSVEEAVTLGKG
jgi:anti-anti-sigma factor